MTKFSKFILHLNTTQKQLPSTMVGCDIGDAYPLNILKKLSYMEQDIHPTTLPQVKSKKCSLTSGYSIFRIHENKGIGKNKNTVSRKCLTQTNAT